MESCKNSGFSAVNCIFAAHLTIAECLYFSAVENNVFLRLYSQKSPEVPKSIGRHRLADGDAGRPEESFIK